MAQTIIGSSVVVDGDISGDESVVIEGTVKGKVTVKDALVVEKSGIVEADVQAATLMVSGQLKGRAEATERLEVKADGRLVGDVKTPKILIAEGAAFKGKIDMDL